jgi:hypothetical protein
VFSKIKRLLLPLAAAGLCLLALAGVASAATYDRTNPMTTGCAASAYTVTWTPIVFQDPLPATGAATTLGYLEVRKSSVCGTKWGRVDLFAPHSVSMWAESNPNIPRTYVNTWGAGGDGTKAFYGTQVYTDQINRGYICVHSDVATYLPGDPVYTNLCG